MRRHVHVPGQTLHVELTAAVVDTSEGGEERLYVNKSNKNEAETDSHDTFSLLLLQPTRQYYLGIRSDPLVHDFGLAT